MEQEKLIDFLQEVFQFLLLNYDLFYKNGVKHIPNDLIIDPLALAVWFMDDGNKSRSSIYLNTQQFILNDQIQLMNILRKELGIESTLNKDKTYYRIRIRTSSTPKFVSLIDQFILKDFRYKLPLCYDPVST